MSKNGEKIEKAEGMKLDTPTPPATVSVADALTADQTSAPQPTGDSQAARKVVVLRARKLAAKDQKANS